MAEHETECSCDVRSVPTSLQILTNLNCNLNCTYCYECKTNKVNNLEQIKAFMAAKYKMATTHQVVVEPIGGESFLYPDLCDEICGYALELSRKYNKCSFVSFCTNGTTLNNIKVRDMLEKYKKIIFLGISIDGIPEHHNTHRVYNDGKPTYDDAVRYLPWAFDILGKTRVGVKSTYTLETFKKYYSKSMIHLIELGFTDLAGNIVFEDILQMSDCFILYEEMKKVIDYIVDNNIEKKVKIFQYGDYDRVRNYAIAKPDPMNESWCGSSKHMACLGFDGLVYGCNRFCTMNKPNMNIGVLNKKQITITNQSLIDEVVSYKRDWSGTCANCVLKTECPTCAAGSYEVEDREAYIKANRQCGWTHAVSMARSYFKSKLIEKESKCLIL